MTFQATTSFANGLANPLTGRTAPRYTSIEHQSDQKSPFAPMVPVNTKGSENSLQKPLPLSRSERTAPTAAIQSIPGVVVEILPETVLIQCNLSGRTVELNLPPAIVPPDLQAYGRTVSISLDYSGGYQRPVVEARSPLAREPLPGEEELDSWIDNLNAQASHPKR